MIEESRDSRPLAEDAARAEDDHCREQEANRGEAQRGGARLEFRGNERADRQARGAPERPDQDAPVMAPALLPEPPTISIVQIWNVRIDW